MFKEPQYNLLNLVVENDGITEFGLMVNQSQTSLLSVGVTDQAGTFLLIVHVLALALQETL